MSLPAPFRLPSVQEDELAWEDALAAVLGYVRARRSLRVCTPASTHVSDVPAFSYSAYDCVPASGDGFSWLDVLVVDSLNGGMSHRHIVALVDAGRRAWDHVREATVRAGDRAFWDLPIEEVIDPAPTGSTGEALSAAWAECFYTTDIGIALTHKVLHHKRPKLFPLIDRQTAPRLEAQVRPGEGRLWAVLHRELDANADQFALLEATLVGLLRQPGDVPLWRLRLHDILLWLEASGQRPWAAEQGRATAEWARYQNDDVDS